MPSSEKDKFAVAMDDTRPCGAQQAGEGVAAAMMSGREKHPHSR